MNDTTIFNGLRDVKSENIASDQFYAPAIRNAIEQGKGGWGVNRHDAVILRLSLEVERTAAAAGLATAYSKELTGKRLELGRAKAAKTRAEVMLTQERAVVDGLKIALENMTAKAQGFNEVAKANAAAAKHQQELNAVLQMDADSAVATLTKQIATLEAEADDLQNEVDRYGK